MAPAYDLPQRQLVSQAAQSMIERPDVPRSTFVGRKMRKTTFDAGYLVPIHVDEILPGDDVTYKVSAYVRSGTPLFPLYSNFRIETFMFYGPTRITWENWTKMMGEQASPGDSIAFSVPVKDSPAGGFAVGSLWDHFGLPTVGQVTAGQVVTVNALPARLYALVWNQWFRDENSVNGLTVSLGNGPDGETLLQRRMKSPDYFTRALPWPQKFTAPAALGTSAPVGGIGVASPAANAAGFPLIGSVTPTQIGGLFTPAFSTTGGAQPLVAAADAAGNTPLNIYADLSAISVNTLRLSFLVQELLERDARGGTRYIEIVKSHFGVTSPDARLQRPEYFGGGSTPLIFTPIAQTATGGAGLGAIGAAGAGFGEHAGRYAATEHGYVIILINVQSELLYQQGLHKMWSRRTRYDFYWPSLAGLGEQAVLRQEIYATGVDADDALVFGYQGRWDEYRQMYSDAVSLFRSTTAGNIDEWHTGQQFTAPPVLGATFLQDDPPMARVLAAGASTNQQFIADIMIERTITRPLPVHGTPQTLGRF